MNLEELYTENKNLKQAMYAIESAVLAYRQAELNKPLSVEQPQVQHKCSCGQKNEADLNPDEIKNLITSLIVNISDLSGRLDKIENNLVKNEDVEIVEQPAEEDTLVEETPVVEEVKERKPRKERGGSVFTDFTTLDLKENNGFEGNSVIYSSKN